MGSFPEACAEGSSDRNASLTMSASAVPAVVAIATPRRNAMEFRRAFWLVARKIAETICGPAFITNASGSTVKKSTDRLLLFAALGLRGGYGGARP